jgi:hypothetical protein
MAPPPGQASPRARPAHVWVSLIAYCFGFALFGAEVTVLGPTLTALARQVNVGVEDLSPLFTTLGLTTIIGGLPSGWLVDRVPGHAIIVVSLVLQVRRRPSPPTSLPEVPAEAPPGPAARAPLQRSRPTLPSPARRPSAWRPCRWRPP